MKIFNKVRLSIFQFYAAIFAMLVVISSCYKDTELRTDKEGVAYMPQAYQDRSKLNLLRVDSVQNTTFGFYYTSFNGAPADITGQFSVDESLVAKYNALNAYTGNVYQLLPATSYTLSGTQGVVKQGAYSSEPLTLAINPKSLILGVKYMLPIKLSSVSSGMIDSTLAVTYFRVDEITIRSRDITVNGTLIGNYTGNGTNEGLPKLVDNNHNSKYLAFNYGSNLFVQLAFSAQYKIDAYTLTSGNDAPERDPKNWNLQGSNDGVNWTTLDTRTGESFTGRNQIRTFNLLNEANYSYYRLNITAINGANLIQFSEWRLLDYY